ncbi:unnamed protein product, partial [Closterium sp. NIES-54]
PVFQACGRAAPGVWRELRRRYLVPADGLPMFGPGFAPRHPGNSSSSDSTGNSSTTATNSSSIPPPWTDEQMARLPASWLAVIARRHKSKRRIAGFPQLVDSMKQIFHPSRVYVFDGKLNVTQASLPSCPSPPPSHPSQNRVQQGSSVRGVARGRPAWPTWFSCLSTPAPRLSPPVFPLPPVLPSHILFCPSPTVPPIPAKTVFNRAAVFVGLHGAGLANMVFMPLNASIFEIRPRGYPNPCYHHLATATQMHYHLILGNGTKDSELKFNHTEAVEVLRLIANRTRARMSAEKFESINLLPPLEAVGEEDWEEGGGEDGEEDEDNGGGGNAELTIRSELRGPQLLPRAHRVDALPSCHPRSTPIPTLALQFEYKKGTKVNKLKRVVNLAYYQGRNFYHGLVEWTPQLFLLSSLLRANPTIPLLAIHDQWDFYENISKPIIGVEQFAMNRLNISRGELFYADEVYLPLYQACGKASPSLWSLLRSHFLLAPQGLPIFPPSSWIQRPGLANPVNQTEAAIVPPDWMVLLVRRPGVKRSLDRWDELYEAAVSVFSLNRVHVLNGSVPMLKARSLFRRARLLIAGHGAAMANMVFMRPNMTIYEIRPDKSNNACYHHLAHACGLQYYLTFGDGDGESVVKIDVGKVTGVLKEIAKTFPPLPGDEHPDDVSIFGDG